MRFLSVLFMLALAACATKKQGEGLPEIEVYEVNRLGIKQSFRDNQKSYGQCYKKALSYKSNFSGTVVLAFDIQKDGFVDNTKIDRTKSTTEPLPLFDDCIIAVLNSQKFPEPPDGQIVNVYYPLAFSKNKTHNK